MFDPKGGHNPPVENPGLDSTEHSNSYWRVETVNTKTPLHSVEIKDRRGEQIKVSLWFNTGRLVDGPGRFAIV